MHLVLHIRLIAAGMGVDYLLCLKTGFLVHLIPSCLPCAIVVFYGAAHFHCL